MKLSCTTSTFQGNGLTIVQAFEHIHNLGIRHCDILSYAKVYPAAAPMSEKRAALKCLEKLDMQVNCGINLPRANPGSFDPQERKAAAAEVIGVAQYIKYLGGRVIMFCEAGGRPDYPSNLDKDQAFENAVETVKMVCDWAGDNEMLVMLELIPYGGNMNSCEAMGAMIQKVGMPNLYANVDFGHCYLQKIHPSRFAQLGDRLFCCHASDNDMVGDEGHVYEKDLVLGTGRADFPNYFQALLDMDVEENARKAGFDESFCLIEVSEKDELGCVRQPDFLMLRSRDYLLSHFPFLHA